MTIRVDAERAFFTSDTHFFHKAMANMRGFKGVVKDMNTVLIEKWNSIVPTNGIVFLLGDVSFAGATATMGVLGQLNGQIHLVKGNHDKVGLESQLNSMFLSVQDYLEVNIQTSPSSEQRIILSHYSHRVWNMHHYGTWHLFGHSHGSMEGIGKSMDVGVDTNNLFPYRYKTIHDILSIKPVHGSDYHRRND